MVCAGWLAGVGGCACWIRRVGARAVGRVSVASEALLASALKTISNDEGSEKKRQKAEGTRQKAGSPFAAAAAGRKYALGGRWSIANKAQHNQTYTLQRENNWGKIIGLCTRNSKYYSAAAASALAGTTNARSGGRFNVRRGGPEERSTHVEPRFKIKKFRATGRQQSDGFRPAMDRFRPAGRPKAQDPAPPSIPRRRRGLIRPIRQRSFPQSAYTPRMGPSNHWAGPIPAHVAERLQTTDM